MKDEDLAVAGRTGPDADGRDPDGPGDQRGDLDGDRLEDDGEGPGLLQADGVLDDAPGLGGASGQGFFAQHMFSIFQTQNGIISMIAVGCRHINSIDLIRNFLEVRLSLF